MKMCSSEAPPRTDRARCSAGLGVEGGNRAWTFDVRRSTFNCALPCLLALLLGGALSCSGEHPAERTVDGSTLSLRLPAELGELRRPAVEFNHGKHAAAMRAEGCSACHPERAGGGLVFKLGAAEYPADADGLMNHFHQRCIGCHTERARAGQTAGPRLCAGCHAARPAPASSWRELRLDYGLHHRHLVWAGKGKCDACHHVLDKASGKLTYVKGQESACSDCHGAADEGRTPSLRNASHQGCVGCHLAEASKNKKAGPTDCLGCHDAARQASYERPLEVPRLKRGQPDAAWIKAPGTRLGAVPFDHAQHEHAGRSCSTCHHKTLKACGRCHTLAGDPEGGGVPMEHAYHLASSEHSCVGCHRQVARGGGCASCHHAINAAPGERTCRICHGGPASADGSGVASPPADGSGVASPPADGSGVASPPADGSGVSQPTGDDAPVEGSEAGEVVAGGEGSASAAPAAPAPLPAPVALAPLPGFSKDFPEQLRIDRLAAEYGPSRLPHGKMVKKLDALVRDSKLAQRFHGSTELLCAGCHHHSPVGTRPPPCVACHESRPHPTRDIPALKAAYHNQCIGCHKQLKLPVGCTDCHKKAEGKVAR